MAISVRFPVMAVMIIVSLLFFCRTISLSAMIQRYFIASSRYTNILFIGLVDKLFGWYNVAILPALMLTLFVLGLYLLLKEIGEMLALGWSRWMIFFLSLLVVYFSITQAPDLYETLYWRAGMTSHFAPLVFIPFFGAFLLRQIRNAQERSPSLWVQAACFIIPLRDRRPFRTSNRADDHRARSGDRVQPGGGVMFVTAGPS